MSAAAWTQAGLRPSLGGMGLQHCEDMAVPAFIGSAAETSHLMFRLLGRESASVPGLQQAAQRYIADSAGAQVPLTIGTVVSKLAQGPVTEELAREMPKRCQAALQEPLDEKKLHTLKQAVAGNDRDRLEATARPHASSWLTCFPSRALGLNIPSQEFRVATRSWLGLTSRRENRSLLKPGVAMYGRHHAVQECILSLCRSAGVPAKREVLIDTSGLRPADVFLPNFSGGLPIAADVTVSHPSQGLTHASDGAAQRCSASERAALDKVDQKNRKYRAQCDARGVQFLPLAVCSFGGWLPQGEDLIKELATRSAGRTGKDEGVVRAQFWERLSIALWRGNARQILHCLA